jgi:3-deoxy-manno-octulosonate cytidylyltransferase (CMP-KDO synthetase)
MRVHVVIPARYASSRLPAKPLKVIAGKPMIQHVCERARASDADDVIVATDDDRIVSACRAFGAEVMMTDAGHVSGTDRIAEVADRSGWDDDDIVVNVQGDEPLIPPAVIAQVGGLLVNEPRAQMATLATPIHDLEDFLNPNVVKTVMAESGRALYFSRAPIPWHREGATSGFSSQRQYDGALRHIGIYSYRVGALQTLACTPPCLLEQYEQLEQLRALWCGMWIQMDVAAATPPIGVDTQDDLDRVRALMGESVATKQTSEEIR